MDKTKKKHIKQYAAWIGLVLLVVVLTVMPMLAQSEAEEDGPVASILEDTVKTGSIEKNLRGGGTLTAAQAEAVELPSGVKITEFLVSNGDTVTQGTPLAAVDKVSLMNAIVQVQDTLDYLRDEIVDAKNDTVSSYINATAGGFVKEVYAQTGDSVQDVMIRNGALAVLSLDGLMAVQIEADLELAGGDTVRVTFADGTEVDGRVESNLDGIVIITVEDDKYEVGAGVELALTDGTIIGSGELYVHNAWRATGFTGKISTVNAKVNSKVGEGATLFTLTDTDYEGYMDSMANLHREYEELLQKMVQMYETGVITAPCDGVISGVDKDSPHLLAAEGGWTVQLLSNVSCNGTDTTGESCTADTHIAGCYYFCIGTEACTAKEHTKGCYFYCSGTANCTAKPGEHNMNCLSLCISSDGTEQCPAFNHKNDCIEKCDSNKEAGKCPATGVHKPTCIESCVSADGVKTKCPAVGTHREDCIGRCDGTADCTATVHHKDTCLTLCDESKDCTAKCHKNTCYLAKLTYYGKASWVQQVGSDGKLIVRQDTATQYQLALGSSGWVLVKPKSLNTATLITPATLPASGGYQVGDVIFTWTGYNDEGEAVKSGTSVYTNLPVQPTIPDVGTTVPGAGVTIPGMGDMSGMGGFDLSGLMGGMGGFPSMGSFGGYGAVTSTFEMYPLDGETLMTVTDQTSMVLNITLDEQDISDAELGQLAQVEITALKGEVFDAEVTEIGLFGTGNGGSSKFTVELTLPYHKDMLEGMNAVAKIPLYTKMEVLTIPVAALVETETGTVVYTAIDKETGDPGSPMEVTTGLSDGENVEILSGLNQGDRIVYSYYDVLELDHTAKTEISF